MVPWDLPQLPAVAAGQGPLSIGAGYAAVAVLILSWTYTYGRNGQPRR